MSVRLDKRQDEYEFARVALADIRPYESNAKVHPKKQIAQIERSIRDFGFTNPLIIDEGGEIIAGHGRFEAARNLGLQHVPAIRAIGLTRTQKRALRIADNRIAQSGVWDKDLLKAELQDLTIELDDISVLGFEGAEIDLLLDPKTGDPADEAIPDAPALAVSKVGDVWLVGAHRIVCGDCREPAVIKALMAGRRADAAFVDPPYNVKIDGHAGGKGKVKHREFAMASGEMSIEEFTVFLEATLGACASVSRNGAVHFVCMDHGHAGELIRAGEAVYDKRLNIVVWVKSNAGMGSLYRSHHELVFVFKVGAAPHYNAVELGKHGRNRTNVWEYASVNAFGSRSMDLALHPTVKPVALVADAIKDVTRRGEIVLDTFLGSGTTLIAANRVGRMCYGAEIDPTYVDVALERFWRLTGTQAVLEETSETFAQVRARRLGSEVAA